MKLAAWLSGNSIRGAIYDAGGAVFVLFDIVTLQTYRTSPWFALAPDGKGGYLLLYREDGGNFAMPTLLTLRTLTRDGRASGAPQTIGMSRSTLSGRLKALVHKNMVELSELSRLVGIGEK